MSNYASEYATGLGLDAELELKEAISAPSARLVRKNHPATPARPPLDQGGRVIAQDDKAAPVSVIGEIVEREQPVRPVVFSVPKADILYDARNWRSADVSIFDSHAEPEEAVTAKNADSVIASGVIDESATEDVTVCASEGTSNKAFHDDQTSQLTFDVNVDELNKKLQWTTNCDLSETDPLSAELGELRFDFRGNLVSPYTYDLKNGIAAALDGELLGLNCHGRMAYLPGYSLPEMLTLLSSVYDQQVLIALRLLNNILVSRVEVVGPPLVGNPDSCMRSKLDYARIHSADNTGREEILRKADTYVLTSAICRRTCGFGFGLKRFNEYLYRSLLIHERLVLVALKSNNPQVVDLALIALCNLLVKTAPDAEFTNTLQVLIGSDEHRINYPAYLTSRRSVLRREDFAEHLLASTDFDLSESLKYAILGPEALAETGRADGQQDAAEELEHRRSDAILSLLLWAEVGQESEILALLISRLALSTNADLAAHCFRLFQGIALHSSFAAKYLHQFLMKRRDVSGNTCVRVVCKKYIDEWLPSVNCQVPSGIIEVLRFIIIDAEAVGKPLTELLSNEQDTLKLDSLVWKMLMSVFSEDKLVTAERSPREDSAVIYGIAELLKIVVNTQNNIDSGSNLLPLYEALLRVFADPCDSMHKLHILSAVISACENEFQVADSSAALSFASIVAQISQRAFPQLIDPSVEGAERAEWTHPVLRIQIAQKACKLFLLIIQTAEDAGPEYQVLRREAFSKAIADIIRDNTAAIQRLVEMVSKDLGEIQPPEIAQDAEDMNLMDYIPIFATSAVMPRSLLLSHRLQLLSNLCQLFRAMKLEFEDGLKQYVQPLTELLHSLRLSARSVCKYVLQFPGRKRFGINTSDYDCFTLTNPLLDSWAQLYCQLRQTLALGTASDDFVFYSCAFRMTTAREVMDLLEDGVLEDDWNILSALACGYCYEDGTGEIALDEEQARLLAAEEIEEKPIRSRLLSTNFLQIFASPFVGRVLYSLGADYSETMEAIGDRVLQRSARILSALELGSIWLYELLETLAQVDLKLDWNIMEDLQRLVLTTDPALRRACVADGSGDGLKTQDSPIMAVLRTQWNELYIDSVKTKLVPMIKNALVEDRICPRLRPLWLWLLSNSRLMPLQASVWLDQASLPICARALSTDEGEDSLLVSTHVCGVPTPQLSYQGNATSSAQLIPAISSWLRDTTISPALVWHVAKSII